MRIEFKALTASLIPACRAFNERLRKHGEPPFLLPKHAPEKKTVPEPHSNSSQHFVAVDESGAVRGGVLLVEHRGWLNNKIVPLINIQSPLSEGLVDRAFSGLSLQMLKFVMGRSPYSYAVGMGNEQNQFPRLLRAAGWLVRPVPFAFAVISPVPFLSQVGPLRAGRKKWLARGAVVSGLGPLVLTAWRVAHPSLSSRAYSLEAVSSWPAGIDAVWDRCRSEVSFSVVRDQVSLAELYPDAQLRLRRFVLLCSGDIVGWSVCLVKKMSGDANFGDLVVGSILDGLADRAHFTALLALTRDALANMGAELIVTNQTQNNWQSGLRRKGFFRGPSNYLLGLSKPLRSDLQSDSSALDRIHVNRGDGDGRLHL